MTGLSAINSIMGSGKQTAADLTGALVARTKYNKYESCRFIHNTGNEKEPGAASRGPRAVALGPYDLRLEATLLGYPEGITEHALLSCMGTVADAAQGTGFAHTFTFRDTVPTVGGYLSVERGFGSGTEAEAANFAINRFEARRVGPFLRCDIKGLGGKPQKVTKSSATYPTVPTLPGTYATAITINALTPEVREWSWYVDHHNEEDGYDDALTRFRKNADYAEHDAGFECELLFPNMGIMERFWEVAGATSPKSIGEANPYVCSIDTKGAIISASDRFQLKLSADRVELESVDIDITNRGLLRQKIKGRCLDDATTGVASVLLVNTAATV